MRGRPVPRQLGQVAPRFVVQETAADHAPGRIRHAALGKRNLRVPGESGYIFLIRQDQRGTRIFLVGNRGMLANAMRGLAMEFGLTVPKGIGKLEELLELVEADKAFPEKARRVFMGLFEQCRALADSIGALDAEIVAHARQDETARRLQTIPGIGPITASLVVATVVDISVFKSARHFAAWLGLVPRQYSTGGKTRLGRITKAGNREIRKLLVLGATSMVYRVPQWNSVLGVWTRKVLERRPVRLVTVALANKMARIVWALMTRKEVYRAKGRATAAAEAAV
ncbi:MAG: IS110 family RNA-guided transposase [Acidiferrobacteraceae bacterium]